MPENRLEESYRKTESIPPMNLVIQSADIFGKEKLVVIQHHDRFYQLRITKQGKLILTK